MVKVIVAKDKVDCSELLGKFLDESHYDVLIEEDTDCYMPSLCDMSIKSDCVSSCDSCPTGSDERRIAFKFRKNYFSKEQQVQAYLGLREAAGASQNRGLAAGPREEKLQNRDWVTNEHLDILDALMDTKERLFDDVDPIDEIRARYKNVKSEATRGLVWLASKVAEHNFKFDDWVEEVRKLPPQERSEKAKDVANKYVSDTTYANQVFSGIAGWFDRYPRIPYGRATSYTANHYDKFEMSFPFLQTLNDAFKKLLPWRWSNQKAAADKIDPAFLVPGTVFTTVTVNKTFRTAAHFDAGDFQDGLSNLLVLSNDGRFTGGYLVFPEYRIAVNVRPGDLLLVNNHEVMHGNTPIVCEDGSERISLVCYFREKMLLLGSKEYEDIRYQFVESRRLDKSHPMQRPLWNGISESMWSSDEWYSYLEKTGGREMLIKYHPESQKTSLEDFF